MDLRDRLGVEVNNDGPPQNSSALGPSPAQLHAVLVPCAAYGVVAVLLSAGYLLSRDTEAFETVRAIVQIAAPAAFLIALAASVALLVRIEAARAKKTDD